MAYIYNYIPNNLILNTHNYNFLSKSEIKEFTNVKFRIQNSNYLNFHTPLGIYNNKIISITNKQLSFLPTVLNHFIGDEYGNKLKETYDNLISIENNIEINEPVLLFMDYESITGTGHSYDLIFYLLYNYINSNLKLKLLVVKSDNNYYNILLSLIKTYFNIEYIFIEINQNYTIKNFYCCQSYQNIFFNEIKEFINNKLIIPIINKFDKINIKTYDNIYKLKTFNKDNVISITAQIPKSFDNFINKNNYFNIDGIDEDYRIYLLNKSKKIIINFGSMYYININYYLLSNDNKYISVITLPYEGTNHFLYKIKDNYYGQSMPSYYTGGFIDQVYNNTFFSGDVILESFFDEYISKTTLLCI